MTSSLHPAADADEREAGLPRGALPLFALTSGLAVASVYFAQPLMGVLATEFSLTPALSGMIISFTQLGYVLGLLFLVPMADVVDRKRLILAILVLSAVTLVVIGLAGSTSILIGALFLMGILAVIIQILVALAALLSAPQDQGRAVGAVTSGVVVGIIGARSLAGPLADWADWRMVYFGTAVLMLVIATTFAFALPRTKATAQSLSYRQLIQSTVGLFLTVPILRIRACLALLLFGAYGVLWTSLALALSAAPVSLSASTIGWFGVAGLAGVVGASYAGKLADRGLAHWTSGIGLATMFAAWWPISQTASPLWIVFLGIAVFDLGGQAVHVTSQSLIFRARPDARNRLVSAYMLFYSAGMGLGALASTAVYAAGGWSAVCMLGAGISGVALIFWALTVRADQATVTVHPSEAVQR
jgi:predicted MFS family arabinose efflux permease